MRKITRILTLYTLAAALLLSQLAPALAQNKMVTPPPPPPMAKKIPKTINIHGTTLVDNYFWLREKANPEVISYLEAENAYTDSVMKPTEALQAALYKEMLSHIKETDDTVPYKEGNYFYYSRTVQGLQYPIYARKPKTLSASEEVTLDANELAKGLKYLGVGAYAVSDDGNYLAYSTDTTGYRQYTLQVKDLRTGKLLPEKIERVGSVMWATDNKTLFYSTEDAVTKRSDKFWRHEIGTDKSDLVYEDKDELFDVYGGRTRDRKMILIASGSKTSTEYRYIPADKPREAPKVILPREAEHEYSVDHRDGLFYIRTNQNAKNFRLVAAPVSDPAKKNWKEVVPHRPSVKIDDLDLFSNHLVLSELEGGLQHIRVIDLKTNKAHRIEFPEPVYTAFVQANREFNTNKLRFAYQSLVTPNSVFDYDMDTRQRTLLKQTEVPGGFDKANYQSERIFATAADGTKIPISVVYRKGTKMDGKAPLLLYGYGSYGASMTPTFSSTRLSLLDRGVVFAIAHIRGGGER
ncbi:MAG TPA: hypothetical protein VD861_03615, partial [Pyrinomonadaceae bacterium]|nr:hypothetical protein [Pyrinomonadaceae bacterium]